MQFDIFTHTQNDARLI